VAGTTRDTIEEMVTIGGYPVRLIDTAGLRESEDAVEQAGVNRTRAQLEQADLLLEVVDASVPENARLEVPEGSTPHRLLILNKTDLGLAAHWQPLLADADVCALSCETGQGLETLVAAMERILAAGASGAGESSVVAVNARHQACLERASASLAAGISGLEGGIEPEFVSLDLRAALDALGEIVGKIDTEDLLGSIFSQFCIGK
jgi:tRNA modification GTPase